MCDPFGTKAAANASNQQTQLMENQQAAHDKAVQQGEAQVNDAFAQFTPDYFNTAQQDYVNAYEPQLDYQYNLASPSLNAALYDRGILESTPGAQAKSQLQTTYNNAQTDIANQGVDFANSLKSNVANTKSNLLGEVASSADPLTMASSAQGAASAVTAPTALPTLGNVFAASLAPFAAGAKSNSGSLNPSFGLPNFTQAPGAGNQNNSVSFG